MLIKTALKLSPNKKYDQALKDEIISVAGKLGLRETEKIYGVTQKTIISWKKSSETGSVNAFSSQTASGRVRKITPELEDAIIKLHYGANKVSASEIKKILDLDCSLKIIYKLLKNNESGIKKQSVTDDWFLDAVKLPEIVNNHTIYLLTAVHSKTGIVISCTTEENIPLYLNLFAEYFLKFLKKINRVNNLNIIIHSGRFKHSKSGLPVDPVLLDKFPQISFLCKIDNSCPLPVMVKKIIKEIPNQIEDINELTQYLDRAFFKENILRIHNNIALDIYLLLFETKHINHNFKSSSILDLIENSGLNQPKNKIISFIEADTFYFNLKNVEQLLQPLTKIADLANDRTVQVRVHLFFGKLLRNSSEIEKSGQLFAKALSIGRMLNDKILFIEAKLEIAHILIRKGQFERSKKLLLRSLDVCRQHHLQKLECAILGELGGVYQIAGNPEAKELFEKQLDIALEINDKIFYCKAMNNLCNYCFYTGERDKGYSYAQKSLAMASKAKDYISMSIANIYIAKYAIITQKYSLAYEALGRNIEIGESKNLKTFLSESLSYLGYVKCLNGEFTAGMADMEKSLALAKLIGDRFKESFAYSIIGQCIMRLKEYKRATFYLNKAIKIDEEINNQVNHISILGNLAVAYNALGLTDKALKFSKMKFEAAKQTGNKFQIALALDTLAYCASKGQKSQEALNYYFEELQYLKFLPNVILYKAVVLMNIGYVYKEIKDFEKAKNLYSKAAKIFQAIPNNQYLAIIYYNLAEIGKMTDKLKDVKKYVYLTKEKAMLANNQALIQKADLLFDSLSGLKD